MPCIVVPIPGGGHAIVKVAKSRKKCFVCGRPGADRLCDYPVSHSPSDLAFTGTCDRLLCQTCRTVIKGADYCPERVEAKRREFDPAEPKAAQSIP